MEKIGVLHAETHLGQLLDRVAQGESITITRDGQPAAMLVPVQLATPRLSHAEIVEQMRELRSRVKPDSMSIREMIEEGRRY